MIIIIKLREKKNKKLVIYRVCQDLQKPIINVLNIRNIFWGQKRHQKFVINCFSDKTSGLSFNKNNLCDVITRH
jgi:hypothetical protein